jgi:tetrapyrrole methylase family protein/MazG family protein
VFGDLSVAGSGEVLRNWDAIKQAERADKGQKKRGALDGIPRDLPALAQSQEQASKAARVGVEWLRSEDVWAKLHEEIAEVQQAASHGSPDRADALLHEIGDLLLAAAVLARHLGVDAESALRTANLRFRRRFERVEQLAAAQGQSLPELTLEQMLALWSRAKADLDDQ